MVGGDGHHVLLKHIFVVGKLVHLLHRLVVEIRLIEPLVGATTQVLRCKPLPASFPRCQEDSVAHVFEIDEHEHRGGDGLALDEETRGVRMHHRRPDVAFVGLEKGDGVFGVEQLARVVL